MRHANEHRRQARECPQGETSKLRSGLSEWTRHVNWGVGRVARQATLATLASGTEDSALPLAARRTAESLARASCGWSLLHLHDGSGWE
eukprot:scaffold60743_cov63-Phaeocystis_antarctica.AAC.3